MRIRIAVVSALLALAAIVLVATPAAAKSNNLLAAAGVSFAPAKATGAEQPAATDLTPRMKFATPAVTADLFTPKQADDPHKIAVGIRSGGYSYGIGGLLRFWFSDVIFFDIGVAHHGYSSLLSYTVVSGTVLYNFKTIDTSDVVTVRIYAGGGITLSHWSYDNIFYNCDCSTTSIGGHGLVGAELIFKQVPKLGVGADAGFYSTNNDFFIGGYGGFGTSIYAIWYFK